MDYVFLSFHVNPLSFATTVTIIVLIFLFTPNVDEHQTSSSKPADNRCDSRRTARVPFWKTTRKEDETRPSLCSTLILINCQCSHARYIRKNRQDCHYHFSSRRKTATANEPTREKLERKAEHFYFFSFRKHAVSREVNVDCNTQLFITNRPLNTAEWWVKRRTLLGQK